VREVFESATGVNEHPVRGACAFLAARERLLPVPHSYVFTRWPAALWTGNAPTTLQIGPESRQLN